MKKWILGLCACAVFSCGNTAELDMLRAQCESGDTKRVQYLLKGDLKGLQRLLDEKVGSACFHTGKIYYFGENGRAKDAAKARNYYRKGCELNDGVACYSLGSMYEKGEGGVQDSAKAIDLLGKACDLNGETCTRAGILLVEQRQSAKAKKFFEKGCGLDSGTACLNLGWLYYYGQGAKQDYGKAKELAGKACDLGIQDGCAAYKNLKNKGY